MTDFRAYGFKGALPNPYAMKDLKDMLIKIIMEAPSERKVQC